jgi:pantoate--beta-alanine ligase
MAVQIVPVETVREPDGLALSSRNQFLSVEERAQAPLLRRALLAAAEAVRAGQTDAAQLRSLVLEEISKAPLARVEYVEIADATTLRPVHTAGADCVIALAVFFGKTRLIDNLWLQ